MASAPKLRMDRSRGYGTVHGERPPGDLHQNTHFFQDNMPFDAHGFLILDAIDDPKIKAIAERKLKKLPTAPPAAEGDSDGAGEDDSDPATTEAVGQQKPTATNSSEVNLEAWLREEVSYPWNLITRTMRDRYHQNMSKQHDVIQFLVEDEKVVPEDQVGPSLRKFLKPAAV
jgi:hypothetical protein